MDEYLNKIICGDCLEVMKKLPNKCVDLVLTDPPYNTGMTKNTGSSSTRLNSFFNDKYTDEEYENLVRGGATQLYRILKDNSCAYIFINWKELGRWLNILKDVGFNIKNTIVWDKVIHGLNYQNYAYTHEFIIFAVKGKTRPNNKQQDDRANGYYKDVWHIRRNMGNNSESDHETIKAKKVIERCMLHGSNEGDTILDPFLGSGTTAIVAQELKRNFIGIEISPEYCKIAQERLNNLQPSLL